MEDKELKKGEILGSKQKKNAGRVEGWHEEGEWTRKRGITSYGMEGEEKETEDIFVASTVGMRREREQTNDERKDKD